MTLIRTILPIFSLIALFSFILLPSTVNAAQETALTVQFLTGEFTVKHVAGKGLVVTHINGDVSSISSDDVLIKFNQKSVKNIYDLRRAIKSVYGKKSVLLYLKNRNQENAFVALRTLSGNPEKEPEYQLSSPSKKSQTAAKPTPAPTPPTALKKVNTPLGLLKQAAGNNSSSPLYYVSLVSPSCHQITHFQGGETSIITMAGNSESSTINFKNGYLKVNKNLVIKKEYESDSLSLARRCGVKPSVAELKFSKMLRSKSGKHLWQYKNISRQCATRALYTDCTIECVDWLSAGTEVFFIVQGIDIARDLLHRRDRSKSCVRSSQ